MWLTLLLASQSSALAGTPSSTDAATPPPRVFVASLHDHELELPKAAWRQLGTHTPVYPASDLQQADRSLTATDLAVNLEGLMTSLASIEAAPAAAGHIDTLLQLEQSLGFIDSSTLRTPLFRTWVQLSRVALETDQDDLFVTIDDRRVSRYALQAAGLLSATPALDDSLSAGPAADEVHGLLGALQQAEIPTMRVCFELGGEPFDAAAFAGSYLLFVNGIEMLVTDPAGMLALSPLRNDIRLVRPDGDAMSTRIDLRPEGDKIYFALDAAQRTVARQVIKAVAAATDDGTAQLPAELVDSLEHYRSLSGEAPIIVALDPSGEDRKSRIELWTYSPSDALLVRGTPES